MYNAYFQFRESPFGVTPDPQFYYNPSDPSVCASICRGIVERKGIFLIVGEPGTGKTTLLRKILQDLGAGVQTAYLSQTLPDDTSLLGLMLDDLSPQAPFQAAADARRRLEGFLIEAARQGKTVALLIDEAQNLSSECLEELRDLSAWEAGGAKLLQIVLAGQPELAAKLEQPDLLPLRQRIALRCALEPLTPDQVALYIDARLQAIDRASADVFESEAVDAIGRFSGGIPRMINHLCDHALLCAYALSAAKVGAGIVREVAADLGIVKPETPVTVAAGAPGSPARAELPKPARESRRKLFAVAVDHARRRGRLLRSKARLGWRFAAAILVGTLTGAALYALRQTSPPAPSPAQTALEAPTSAESSSTSRNSPQDSPAASLARNRADAEAGAVPPAAPAAIDASFSTAELPGDAAVENQKAAPESAAVAPDEPKSTREPNPRAEPEPAPAPRPASYTVVGRSFVRSQPTSNAEIIATLEPGARLSVTGKTGEYFRIRAAGKEPVAGFVHREDAFFEKRE